MLAHSRRWIVGQPEGSSYSMPGTDTLIALQPIAEACRTASAFSIWDSAGASYP